MKILFVSGNLSNGGAQRVIALVASQLAEAGQDVSLLLFNHNKEEYPLSDKVQVTALRDSFEEYQKIPRAKRTILIRKQLKAIKPDVAVGFTEGGYALYLSSFGMKFKKIASARTDPKILWAKKGLNAAINRRWFSRADAIVLQTDKQMEHMPPKLCRRCLVIPNPVSEGALHAGERAVAEHCRSFVMAGRLSEEKNYPMAFHAVATVAEKYPDVQLDIFGKGACQEQLSQMVEQMGLSRNIHLRGWTKNTIQEYLRHDAYLLTSNFEGMPNALMEAMATGLPCIATDCDTGPSDLIRDGVSGLLVPVDDARALADQMLALMEMPKEQRAAMGQAAHDTMAAGFTMDAIGKRWLELMEDQLNR